MNSRNRLSVLTLISVLAAGPGCKTSGEYVWVDDIPQTPQVTDREYLIQAGDIISVRVWGQDALSSRSRVRPDGKISLPYVPEIQAAGVTPTVLSKKIQASLMELLVNPVVTVTLDEQRPLQVSVLGEIARPGSFVLDQNPGVLQAIAMAGGMTPFANKDAITVIRQRPEGGAPQRIRFTYEALTQIKGRAAAFRLQGGDVVVVE